jgi:hypothetical protein
VHCGSFLKNLHTDSNLPFPTFTLTLPLVEATADEKLMTFVNVLGLVTFLSIVFYHFVVATKKDAEI